MMKTARASWKLTILAASALLLQGCDQISQLRGPKPQELGEQAMSAGDYPKAVRYFEAALDGTPETADLHYKLGIIYDAHLKEPTSAIHHYRRYLRMAENPSHKSEIDRSIERLQREMATRMGEGGLISRAEAVRLRNENNDLRKLVSQLRAEKSAAEARARAASTQAAKAGTARDRRSGTPVAGRALPAEPVQPAITADTRTYKVQPGDTLASISRKFYQTPARWKDIADANHNQLNGGTNIREGMVLIIP